MPLTESIHPASSENAEARQLFFKNTRMASSNLALSLFFLSGSVRSDMQLLYQFCRTVDDIADDVSRSSQERQAELNRWREALQKPEVLPTDFAEMLKRTSLNKKWLFALLDGMDVDVQPTVCMADSTALQKYAWQVASAVGRASAWIFGVRSEAGEDYAEKLGYALQYTNILRDISEDAQMQRIYLPLSDLTREGVRQERFLEGVQSRGMKRLLELHAQRAVYAFSLIENGPPHEEAILFRPALAMHKIYERLLNLMLQDGLRVWEKRYSLSWPSKLKILANTFRAR
ncbi:MAG: phytoene/squalene synthase family protein [Chthoniobacterales bacterium]